MKNKNIIVIINYNMGNLRSVYNKFKKMNIECLISSNCNDIEKADKLVLPGVGHFKRGMQNLANMNLLEPINKKVIDQRTPIFGICLGTQLFAKKSEEGNCEGLGWLDAEVVRFQIDNKKKYKVPHMGWNNVVITNSNKIDQNIKKDDQFYFVHSYHLDCKNENDIWMKTSYEYEFVSAIRHENIFGTQFHPEKSHDVGYELLKKFVEL